MQPSSNQPPVIVHKEGDEGTLEVDRLTGVITTPPDQRPDWASGLAVAVFAERDRFYKSRLGPAYSTNADAIAYADLTWIGVDAEGNEVEVEANDEYRMEMVAAALGIDREGEDFGEVIAEVTVAHDRERTADEAAIMDQGMAEAFGQAEEAKQAKEG